MFRPDAPCYKRANMKTLLVVPAALAAAA